MTSRHLHRAAELAASAALVACLFPGTFWAASSIESALGERVSSTLASKNIEATVEMDGRNAIITIYDADQATQVKDLVTQVDWIANVEVSMAPIAISNPEPEVDTQPTVEVSQPSDTTSNATPTPAATPTPDPLPGDLTMLFTGGSAEIRPDTQAQANELAQLLIDHPRWRVTLIGHTDNGLTEEERMALGFDRAQAIADVLTAQGIPADRITVESRGDHEPVGDLNTEEGLAMNRRVVAHVEEIA